MNYRDELRKAHQNEIAIVDVYIADQVESSFDDLTDEQFEQLCGIVKYCWDCGRPIDDTINFILDKCYYSYGDDIQLFLGRNSAEEIENNMRR